MAVDIGIAQEGGWDIGAVQSDAAAPAPGRRYYLTSWWVVFFLLVL